QLESQSSGHGASTAAGDDRRRDSRPVERPCPLHGQVVAPRGRLCRTGRGRRTDPGRREDRSKNHRRSAKQLVTRRRAGWTTIESEYNETVKLPLYTRIIKFRAHAEGPI